MTFASLASFIFANISFKSASKKFDTTHIDSGLPPKESRNDNFIWGAWLLSDNGFKWF